MIINADNVDLVCRGFKTVYTEAYLHAPSHSEKVVKRVPSSAREEIYGWMGRFPQMREWVGLRHVKGLAEFRTRGRSAGELRAPERQPRCQDARVPAARRIRELRAEASGIWGRVEMTAPAREMIARREYRDNSPSLLSDPKPKAVLRLKGAGLAHHPNLELITLANEETAMRPATDPAARESDPERPRCDGPPGRGAAPAAGPGDTRAIMAAVIAALRASGANLATAGEDFDPAQHVPSTRCTS